MKSLSLALLYLFAMHYLFVADKLKGMESLCAMIAVLLSALLVGSEISKRE